MKLKWKLIFVVLLFSLSAKLAMANTTVTNIIASDNFSGKIDNQTENGFSAIFAAGENLAGSMHVEVNPNDVGKESLLYLVAQWNSNWYMYDQSGNWQPWNQQLKDLVPYASRVLQANEKLDLPLDQAQQEGEYILFAGYLNEAQQIIFNRKPLAFMLLDETQTGLQPFSSPDILEQILKDGLKVQANTAQLVGLDFVTADNAATAPTGTASRNFSTTNTQEAGVEEADRIKTDGTHLYVLGDCENLNHVTPIDNGASSLTLVDTIPGTSPDVNNSCITTYTLLENPAGTEEISKTTLSSDHFFNKLYLVDSQAENQTDWLIAIGQNNGGYMTWYDPWSWQSQTTEIQWINVDDKSTPTMATHLKLDGQLISSRRIDRVLYVVTRFTPVINNYNRFPINEEDRALNEQILQKTSLPELLPSISYNRDTFDELVTAENCFMSPFAKDVMPDPSIITITAIPLDRPTQASSTCIVGGTETLYMSPDNLYLATTKYQYSRFAADQGTNFITEPIFNIEHKTEIHKFSIDGINVTYKGSGEVMGHLGWHEDKKPFRLSEHDGVLRVATSIGDNWGQQRTSSTSLWTLKEAADTAKLEVIGSLEGLGKPGEQLYASRFMDDRGYLVTFLLTDPLYVLDLSDPTSPIILGELEIEGYSDYLHPVGRDHVLGVGKDAIEDTQSTDRLSRGAWYQGLKLSLFDVSDPTQPSEVNSIILGKRGTESDVLNDHHALAYLPPNDLRGARIAIPVSLHENTPDFIPAEDLSHPSTYYSLTHTGLYLFDINVTGDAGIKQKGEIILQQEQNGQSRFLTNFGRTDRAVLLNDSVHYIHGSDITSANWSDF